MSMHKISSAHFWVQNFRFRCTPAPQISLNGNDVEIILNALEADMPWREIALLLLVRLCVRLVG